VAVLPERGDLAPLLEEARVEVVAQPLAILRREVLGSPGAVAALAGRRLRDVRPLGQLAGERNAAIVHSNTSVVLSGQALARRAGARHVMHVREIYAGAGGRAAGALWPVMRRRIERADAVVCISRAVADQFRDGTVIYDGLPRVPEPVERATARTVLGVPEDAFAVALIGRLSDWKGQRELVDAISGSDMVALIAGDPFPGNEEVEQELRGTDGKRVKLLGFREDIETVLGAADAVAVPSTRPEPLGLVALEAAAAGLPVVASAHGGLTEVVRDGETGLLVPPGDRAALAAELGRLADDPALRERLGEAAARDVRRRFSVERMLDELQELYERLLSPA
jgi:glycosyltransferase involved in cell wall biosynthesis